MSYFGRYNQVKSARAHMIPTIKGIKKRIAVLFSLGLILGAIL